MKHLVMYGVNINEYKAVSIERICPLKIRISNLLLLRKT